MKYELKLQDMQNIFYMHIWYLLQNIVMVFANIANSVRFIGC